MFQGYFTSETVFALSSLIFPIEFCGSFSPYFTIFDPMFNDVKDLKSVKNDLLLGITNPLIAKV